MLPESSYHIGLCNYHPLGSVCPPPPQYATESPYVLPQDDLLFASLHPVDRPDTKTLIKMVDTADSGHLENAYPRNRIAPHIQHFQTDDCHNGKDNYEFQNMMKIHRQMEQKDELYWENSDFKVPLHVQEDVNVPVDIPALRRTLRGIENRLETRPRTPVLAGHNDRIQSDGGSLDESDIDSTERRHNSSISEDVFYYKTSSDDPSNNDYPLYDTSSYEQSPYYPPPRYFSVPSIQQTPSAIMKSNLQFWSREEDVYDPSLPYVPVWEKDVEENGERESSGYKSALKGTTWTQESGESDQGNDLSVYNPSQPLIAHWENDEKEEKQGGTQGLKSALKGSVRPQSSDGNSRWSGVSDVTSVTPALDDWHKTMGATSRLGWALVLYHAVRNNFKPHAFARLAFQGSRELVRAVADYITRESTLLSFKKGDIIRVSGAHHYGDNGWLQGTLDGRTGLFPVNYVVPIGRSEARAAAAAAVATAATAVTGNSSVTTAATTTTTTSVVTSAKSQAEVIDKSLIESESEVRSHVNTGTWTQQQATHASLRLHTHHDDSGHSSGGEGGGGGPGSGGGGGGSSSPPVVHDGKHSLLQFALQHFRLSKEQGIVQSDGTLQTNKSKKKKSNKDHQAEWTWKEQVEMVKFSQSPLTASLLPLEPELSQMAVESFVAVMRYMGDYPMAPQHTEVHCVYTILMNCHKHPVLRDEVYCQIMKQTTNNKSSIPDSCQRGWRLFSIVAAYFTCSENLKPYLFKYLETAAYDKRRAYHGTAMVCLQNLRKTFNYGGRKNVPSIEEITAITAGRNSKRQIYRLPGGTERVINTKSTSVVQDIIEEMCNLINVRSPHEQEEYSLYCIVEGDTFTMPLAREEYILDVTTELLKNQQVFYLIFCRSVWYYPLRPDNPLYYEVVFNQIAPDYLEGLLLVTPGGQLQQDVIYDIAKVAALLHRAADLEDVPTMKEVKYLLPKPALTVRDVKPPQWVNMVQSAWPEVSTLTSLQAKAQVLEILQSWGLFGSSFFAVKRITEPKEKTDYILALNKNGVHFLDFLTHETIISYNLAEVMSTRKVKSEDELFLDMKCGNLMQQRITRIQTDQAHEISRLIRQYITIEQRVMGHSRGDNPKDVTLSR